jgi:hypothetical protein
MKFQLLIVCISLSTFGLKASFSDSSDHFHKKYRTEKEDFMTIPDPSLMSYNNHYHTKLNPYSYSIKDNTYNRSSNQATKKERPPNTSNQESNIITYTPSVLLKHHALEFQIYNNLYTQTSWRDKEGKEVPLNQRSSYYTVMFQFGYGISKAGKINIGLDINLKSVRNDPDRKSSPFKTLLFKKRSFTQTAITTLGPTVKFAPLRNIKGLSVESSFWFPVADNVERAPWLDYNRYTSWTRVYYDKNFGNNYQLFTEMGVLMRLQKDFKMDRTITEMPLSLYFSYFPTNHLVFYGMSQYSPTITNPNTFYTQLGAGIKYQVLPKLNIELMYSDFIYSANKGAGRTINLGIRYIK